jgi:hypothetical protein
MAEHDDISFRNLNIKEKTVVVVGITLLILLVFGFIVGLYFFGFIGVFKVFGIEYQSMWSLVMFVVCFYILGLVADLFFDSMAKIAVQNVTSTVKVFSIKMLSGFASNWLVLMTVDSIMESITLSSLTKLIVALLLGVLEPVFGNKDLKNKLINK